MNVVSTKGPARRQSVQVIDMCECGRGPIERKPIVGQQYRGCVDCNALDGGTPRHRDVVHHLRLNGRSSVKQIAAGISASLSATGYLLQRMQACNLVRRQRLCCGMGSGRLIDDQWSLRPPTETKGSK